ncbi:MAG: NPCBM/NEW2 domain-containing protein [Planctomycetota bacterium]|nr:NPCBM/NEW2 domain-containing protein [Planctomycetota bacterium]
MSIPFRPGVFAIAIAILTAAGPLRAGDGPLLVPVEGEPFPATLAASDSDDSLVFNAAGGRRVFARRDIVCWGRCAEPERGPVLLLRDGSLLAARRVDLKDGVIGADADSLGQLEIPFSRLAAVVLELPAAPVQRDRLLDRALQAETAETRAVLLNGDVVRGRLLALGGTEIQLETEVGPVTLALDRISSITFPQAADAESAAAPGRIVVGLDDGSRVLAERLAIGEREATLVGGGVASTIDPQRIVFLQPASDRVVYLSDLAPDGYRHVPFLNLAWDYRLDRNVLGGRLRNAGQIHLKGIGMHTASRLTFAPPEDARSFQASLAIDAAARELGSVRFRVFVDGGQKYVSPTIRGGAPPAPIEVDVRGAQRVDLVVDYADRADVQDHANWLGARFVR